jgi:RNA polymerase sigma-70 factor (ECF subfamily)
MTPEDKEAILKAVVKQVLDGHTGAFQYVVDQYKTLVYTTAYRIVRNREEAEEVAQDAFMRAYRSLKNFGWNASFSSWLYRIVYNTALTRIRSRGLPAEALNEQQDYPSYSESGREWRQLQRDERERFINLALDRLSPDDGLVLTLFYISESSIPEIASITAWGLSATKVRLHRARKRLLDELRLVLKGETRDLL